MRPLTRSSFESWVFRREEHELTRRARVYGGDRQPPTMSGRTIILIDDGLATGSMMRVAAEAIRQQQPSRLIVAVPVAASSFSELHILTGVGRRL